MMNIASYKVCVARQCTSVVQICTLCVLLPRVQRANLSPLMDSPGPHTVFIPTNNAFSAMEEGQLEYLTTDEVRGRPPVSYLPAL